MVPGAACVDAPLLRHDPAQPGWLLGELGELGELGGDFTLMVFGDGNVIPSDVQHKLATGAVPVRIVLVLAQGQPAAAPHGVRRVTDSEGLLARRYDGRAGTCYLIRPDQHVCARWRAFDADAIHAALLRALCRPPDSPPH
ncbi:FAD-dependent oxidoreductase [compost metagenome]